jgi:tetratricopeptide (TPR) repeat protein
VKIKTILTHRRAPLWAGLVVGLAILAAYQNSFRGEFVFDDVTGIEENPSIRHFGSAFFPPAGALTVSGRPVLNLSFALNYAISGTNPWSYHLLNVLVHVLATLTLFGLFRRTLELPAGRRQGAGRTPVTLVALTAALIWGLHPLQTEAVSYAVQRAESMMGLFYLLTCYGFLRYAEETAPRRSAWAALAVVSCLLGMGTKEVMVSAPLIVLLYDRCLVSGSLREAWRRHHRLHASLAATWLLLGCLLLQNGDHAGTAGFHLGGGAGSYWLTQFPAIIRYLGLSFWPHPLVFDYGVQAQPSPAVALAAMAIVGLLAAGTVWGLIRNSLGGFLGAVFFSVLAPTSLVPGNQQTMAEHRMYLALIALVALGMAGALSLTKRIPAAGKPGLAFGLTAAVVFGVMTCRRNDDYRSDLAMWADTVAKQPSLAIAHHNLGRAYSERALFAPAAAEYREALRLNPDSIYGRMDLARNLEELGRGPEALALYGQAVRLQPGWAGTHASLADALSRAGRAREAISQYQRALQLQPLYPSAENGWGMALFRLGEGPEALAHFQAALRLDPRYAEAENNLGTVLASLNRPAEAIACFERAIQWKPTYAEAHLNLGNSYYQVQRLSDAIREYEEALPGVGASADVHNHLGIMLAEAGRLAEAQAQFQAALRINPAHSEARQNLLRIRAITGGTTGP